MEIVQLSLNELDQIKSMWGDLNSLHGALSVSFKEHFASITFEKRCEIFSSKDALVIFAAKVNEELVGYCIASVQGGVGELDSLFVKPDHRELRIGKRLASSAITWLKSQKCGQIDIQVAYGNEAVLSFYEEFGFKKRSHVLQLKGI